MKSRKGVIPRKWTKQETDILRKLFPKIGPAETARRINKALGFESRNRRSVSLKALSMALVYKNHNRYTKKEHDVIRKLYPTKGASYIAKILGRTYNSISLQAGRIGVKRIVKRESNVLFGGHGTLSKTTWNKIQNAANRRQIPFKITIKYGWKLFEEQTRRCALSGLLLKFSSSSSIFDGTASLDRIDSSRGYIKGNVQWIHKRINRMKWDMDDASFVLFCKAIADHNFKKQGNKTISLS